MDIFSLGCVIYELVTDGKLLFRLGDVLDYRQGKFDIGPALAKISNTDIREMVRGYIPPRLFSRTATCLYVCVQHSSLLHPHVTGVRT